VIPTHQGRAAERILCQIAVRPGALVPSNGHFDTTRANIEFAGAEAVDLPIAEAGHPEVEVPFKGNIDLERLERVVRQERARIPFGMLTLTNNTGGGQPVSLENVRAAAAILHAQEIPLILDACRFAENAYLVKLREAGQAERPAAEIAREIFRLADGCTLSAKKDGLSNMGGFLALNDDGWAERGRHLLILTEGFPTYGGCAARDLEAVTVGLSEVLEEAYLEYRLATVTWVARGLDRAGIPTVKPWGGHAVFVDAKALLPHIPPERFPGLAFACELYLAGGIRSCEIGSVMFGKVGEDQQFRAAPLELVRLAIPRRVYTQSHMERVVEVCAQVAADSSTLSGYSMVERPPFLPHFTARFRPGAPEPAGV
jgi:tryptophanase